MEKPTSDLKFIPMNPSESNDTIITRVIDSVKAFSEEIAGLKLYEYTPDPPPEYLTEVMADRAYFVRIMEYTNFIPSRNRVCSPTKI
jgi:hypothetical protein